MTKEEFLNLIRQNRGLMDDATYTKLLKMTEVSSGKKLDFIAAALQQARVKMDKAGGAAKAMTLHIKNETEKIKKERRKLEKNVKVLNENLENEEKGNAMQRLQSILHDM